MQAKKNSGLTIVELLVVIMILAIIAAIFIPLFRDAMQEKSAPATTQEASQTNDVTKEGGINE